MVCSCGGRTCAAVGHCARDRAATTSGSPVRRAVGSFHLALGVLVHRPLVGAEVCRRRRTNGDGDGVGVLTGGHGESCCLVEAVVGSVLIVDKVLRNRFGICLL